MELQDIYEEIEARIARARSRYGFFASTHEALGVAMEEWDELKDSIRENALYSVEHEALDLAAVLINLVYSLRHSTNMRERSIK